MPEPEIPRIIAVSNRFRRELLTGEREAATRLVNAYGGVWRRLSPRFDALLAQIEARQIAGQEVHPDWLRRQERYESLLVQVLEELGRFVSFADLTIQGQQERFVAAAPENAQELVGQALPSGLGFQQLAEVGIEWNRLPTEAVIDLVGTLQNGSPLATLLQGIPGNVSLAVGDALVNGVAQGWGPRKTANVVRRETGMGLSRALRISRTETLRSYRTASRRQYEANPRIVKGWRRHAAKDSRTCFLAGTLVETEQGARPIELLVPGMKVLTHTGCYQRVVAVMQKPYFGTLAMLHAGPHQVTATADHPFLTERQGQLQWCEASTIGVGDKVVRYANRSANKANHAFSYRSVESNVIQADNPVASTFQPKSLASILLAHSLKPVPVGAVNLYHGIQRRNVEVDGIAPTWERVFLQESNSDVLKTLADSRFWFRFASVPPVAASAAELGMQGRHASKLLATGWASDYLRRATALLRAVSAPILADTKLLATPLAIGIAGIGKFAASRAIYALGDLAQRDAKGLAATGAYLVNIRCCPPAGLGTVWASVVSSIGPKRLSALLAQYLSFRLSRLTAFRGRVRMQMLVGTGTCPRAKAATLGGPGGGEFNNFTAYRTGNGDTALKAGRLAEFAAFRGTVGVGLVPIADVNPGIGATDRTLALQFAPNPFNVQSVAFHTAIISQTARPVQGSTTVYNLEVETDHSYVANGFVVHNCLACLMLDGKEYSTQADMDDHVQGRCAMVPNTITYQDLGIPVDSPPIDWEKGRQWFERQPAAVQAEMMGPARFKAWRDGKFDLSQLPKLHTDPDWGDSWTTASLKDLGIDWRQLGLDEAA